MATKERTDRSGAALNDAHYFKDNKPHECPLPHPPWLGTLRNAAITFHKRLLRRLRGPHIKIIPIRNSRDLNAKLLSTSASWLLT